MERVPVAHAEILMDFGDEGEYEIVFKPVTLDATRDRTQRAEGASIPAALHALADAMEQAGVREMSQLRPQG